MNLHHGDCLEVMQEIEGGSVDAIVTDPPYNIGKAAWDKIPDYLQWCETWIAEASRCCKRQGAFWCFHSEPLVLADIARIIERHGRANRNFITWEKATDRGLAGRGTFAPGSEGLRCFYPNTEYIVYHADDGQWTAQSDQCRGFIFEPLRVYLAGEWERAGLTAKDANKACGNQMPRHYMIRSQWALPTEPNYIKLREYANAQGGDGDYLRREYDDLRREYEHLRPTFNNPGKVSSVWQFPPAKPNGHITPKPEPLMRRIIEATTNPGDMVLDPFMGSGTTGVACVNTDRDFIGIELDADYYAIAEKRIQAAKETPRQEGLFE